MTRSGGLGGGTMNSAGGGTNSIVQGNLCLYAWSAFLDP